MKNDAQHISQTQKIEKRVKLKGTSGDVFKLGDGVCYDRDYGTAADREGRRDKYVERPTVSNGLNFAGVLAANVTLPSTGEVMVTIYEPGSTCLVSLGSDTVVNATHLWALAGSGDAAGRFRSDTGAKLGRGAAKALQTVTTGNLGESIDGTAVVSTKTVTKTGLFASASVGDIVVILASSTAAGAAGATQGQYTIATVTDADNAILATAPGDGDLACYVISGNPVALAYLYDGEETGLVEWIEALDNAASQSMVSGVTHILGGVTLGAGDSTSTLADGTFPGQSKGFSLHGALTTQDYLLTVTSGFQGVAAAEAATATTALATIEIDGDGDYTFLEWFQDEWIITKHGGPTIA